MSTGSPTNNKGAILIAVLGMLLILTFIVTEFLHETTDKIEYVSQVEIDPDMRNTAHSALTLILGVLSEYLEIEGTLNSPIQGWANPIHQSKYVFPGYEIDVNFVDESAKIPLKKFDEKLLSAVFEKLEIPLTDNKEILEVLREWMDIKEEVKKVSQKKETPNQNKQTELRRQSDTLKQVETKKEKTIRTLKIQKPIASIREFFYIKPFRKVFFKDNKKPRKIYRKFIENVSLYSKSSININNTSKFLSKILADLEGFDYEDFKEKQKEEDFFLQKNDDIPFSRKAPKDSLLSTQIELLRIDIQVKRGPLRFFLSALIQIPQKKMTQAPPASQEKQKEEETLQETTNNKEKSVASGLKILVISENNSII